MKNIIFFVALSCATIFGAIYAHANNDNRSIRNNIHISGQTINADTKEHLVGATVIIKEVNGLGAISDATGNYTLENLKKGEYTIEVSLMGYKTISKVITISDESVTLDFEMEIEPISFDEVVISGTRNETKKRENPTVVGVVSSQQFEITSSANAAEGLNFQPGLRVEYGCSNCGLPQLRINGLEGQYSQMLIDSRPILSSLSSVYGLEQLPASMIERVEVIRGGGSALYGSSAIGGVVNIITKEPVKNTLSVSNTTSSYEGGSIDINTSLNGSFVSEDTRFGLYMFSSVRDREEYDRDGDGFSEVPILNNKTIGFRSYYRTSRFSKITLEYHNLSEYRRGGDLLSLPAHEANIAEELNHDINGGGIKYDYFSENEKHRLSVYSSFQDTKRESYFGTGQDLNAYGNSDDLTAVVGTQYNYYADKFLFMPSELTAGAEYNYNKLNDVALGYDRNISQQTDIAGIFVQNEWKTDRFSLLLGFRADKHNLIDNIIVSPRANIRYAPVKDVVFRASYSSGYRAPQAYNEDLHISVVGGEAALIVLADNLKPEYANSFNLSTDLYKTIGNTAMNLLIEGFHTKVTDVFTLEPIGNDNNGNMLFERRNSEGMSVTGVNIEARANYKSILNIQGGYTYQRSVYESPVAWSSTAEMVTDMLRTPNSYGYLSVGYDVTKRLQLTANGVYTGSMDIPHYAGYITNDVLVKTESFFDLGAKIAYNFKLSNELNLELSGGVKNIFDSYQDDLDQGIERDSKYFYGPIQPRTYYFGVKITI